MRIEYTKAARKELKRLPASISSRILAKIEAYAAEPSGQSNNVRALKGRPGYRLRAGDYRVIFTIEGSAVEIMVVYKVAHRKEVYDE